MSRKDRLLKEIDWLKEKRKDWFNILFALVSVIVLLVYAVLTGEKPVFFLTIAAFGFFFMMIIAVIYKRIERKISSKLDELEHED